jgi:hypothetical protein
MLEKILGSMFFLKHPKNYEKGDKYIYLRITGDGVSKELSTKRDWYPARWHVRSGSASGKAHINWQINLEKLKDYLATLSQFINII